MQMNPKLIFGLAFVGAVIGFFLSQFAPIFGSDFVKAAGQPFSRALMAGLWSHVLAFGGAGAVVGLLLSNRRSQAGAAMGDRGGAVTAAQQVNTISAPSFASDRGSAVAEQPAMGLPLGHAALVLRQRYAASYAIVRLLFFTGALVIAVGLISIICAPDERDLPWGVYGPGTMLLIGVGVMMLAGSHHMRASVDRTIFSAPVLSVEEKFELLQSAPKQAFALNMLLNIR